MTTINAESEALAVSWVGRPIKRKEDLRLIRGRGQYLADIKLPGMVHAFFVRSKHAHARLKSVDVSRALSVPGVVAAYSGADLLKLGMRELLIPELQRRGLTRTEYRGTTLRDLLAQDTPA